MNIKKSILFLINIFLFCNLFAQQNIGVTWGSTSLEYNGTPQIPSVIDDTLSLVYSGQQTIVGTNYKAWVTCSNPNYHLQNDTIYFNITPKSVTITGLSAQNKVYDGTTAATISGGTINGNLDGANLNFSGAANFNNKNVGINKIVTFSGFSLNGSMAGNYTLLAQPTSVTANITAKSVTISGLSANNKVYDGTTTATTSGGTINGNLDGSNLTFSGNANFDNPNVGINKTVTFSSFSLNGLAAGNYLLSVQPTSVTANITAKSVTISGLTIENKVYDATTMASISGSATIVGNLDGTNLAISSGTASFNNKNVGTNKMVTFSGFSLSGSAAGNYILFAQPTSVTANITAKSVIITGLSANNKVYDGTTMATTSGGTIDGNLDGPNLTFSGTANFDNSNVGINKIVTFSGYSLNGSEVNNYILSAQPINQTADITQKSITILGLSAQNKVYDANTSATIFGIATLSDNFDGSNLQILSGTANFDNANVGIGKTVTFSNFSLSGSAANNYLLSAQPRSVTADITAKSVIISGLFAEDKIYDATTTATISGTGMIIGNLDGTNLNISPGIATFDNKNIGTNKTVTFSSFSLHGSSIGNYILSSQPVSVTANITAKSVTISGLSANDKVYDGTITATTSGGTIDGNLDGLNLTFSGIATFDNANVGSNKAVTFSNYILIGSEANNYLLSAQPIVDSANITQKSVSIIGLSAQNKVYDGNTSVTILGTATLSENFDGSNLQITIGMASFDNANVGIGKTVTFSNYSLSGSAIGNYLLLGQPASVTADIIAKSVTISGLTAENKIYDATTIATISGSAMIVGNLDGINLTVTIGNANFDNKNVGINKTVTFSGFSLNGSMAGNYALFSQPASVTADINAQSVAIIELSANDKVYDGTTTATTNGGIIDGNLDGTNLTFSGTATFDNANVGTNKIVTFSNYVLNGSEANNYLLSTQPPSVTANITQKPITVEWNDTIFVWDGEPHYPTAIAIGINSYQIPLYLDDSTKFEVGNYTALVNTTDENYQLINDLFNWQIVCLEISEKELSGDTAVCRNEFNMEYSVPIEEGLEYQWSIEGGEITSNIDSNVIMIHWNEEIGVGILTLQQTHIRSGCITLTEYPIIKTENFAPNKTRISQKNNSNILICEDNTQGIHYQWGFINNTTKEETLIEGAFANYQYIEIPHPIDTVQYEYFVEIYYHNAICLTRTFYPTDIQNTELRKMQTAKIHTYPNPTKSNLSVSVEKEIKHYFTISLQNIFGQTIFIKQSYDYKANEIMNFDFDFPSGIYLLVIKSSEEVFTSKIVIE